MIKRDRIECLQVFVKKPILLKLEEQIVADKIKNGLNEQNRSRGAKIDNILADYLKIENPKE